MAVIDKAPARNTSTMDPALERRLAKLGLTGQEERWTDRYMLCTHLVDPASAKSRQKFEAVSQFATAIAMNRTQLSDSDVNALKAAGYDQRAAVAIALAAGAKTLANTVAHLSRPEIDPGFQPMAK